MVNFLPSVKNVEPYPGTIQLSRWISLLFDICHSFLNYQASAVRKFSKHPTKRKKLVNLYKHESNVKSKNLKIKFKINQFKSVCICPHRKAITLKIKCT